MNNNPQKYNAYKPSGVEWIGEIPEHWEVKKITHIFDKIGSGTTPTAGTPKYYDNGHINWLQTGDLTDGLIKKTSKKLTDKAVSDFSTLKTYPKESLVIAMYGATIGKVGYLGIDTTTNQACCVLGKPNNFITKFGFYWFLGAKSVIVSMSYGGGQPNISQDLVKSLRLPIPPLSEQQKIAEFLDLKTAQIDNAISIKEKQIELLKERRQILIHRAVTRGINPTVTLKNSGVEWIGDIPEHWEMKRAKYLFDEINERSQTGEEELMSVSHLTGVTPRSEKNVTMFQSEDYTGSKLCQKGDLIFNIMWAWMGALGVSDRTGIVSPSYAIYRQKDSNTFNTKYLEQLLTNIEYIAHYNRVSTGLHSSRLRFYSNMFFEMQIGFPPIEEQNAIAEYLEIITQKIATALSCKEQEILKLKEYKSVLINSAVTGKVRVGV